MPKKLVKNSKKQPKSLSEEILPNLPTYLPDDYFYYCFLNNCPLEICTCPQNNINQVENDCQKHPNEFLNAQGDNIHDIISHFNCHICLENESLQHDNRLVRCQECSFQGHFKCLKLMYNSPCPVCKSVKLPIYAIETISKYGRDNWKPALEKEIDQLIEKTYTINILPLKQKKDQELKELQQQEEILLTKKRQRQEQWEMEDKEMYDFLEEYVNECIWVTKNGQVLTSNQMHKKQKTCENFPLEKNNQTDIDIEFKSIANEITKIIQLK